MRDWSWRRCSASPHKLILAVPRSLGGPRSNCRSISQPSIPCGYHRFRRRGCESCDGTQISNRRSAVIHASIRDPALSGNVDQVENSKLCIVCQCRFNDLAMKEGQRAIPCSPFAREGASMHHRLIHHVSSRPARLANIVHVLTKVSKT